MGIGIRAVRFARGVAVLGLAFAAGACGDDNAAAAGAAAQAGGGRGGPGRLGGPGGPGGSRVVAVETARAETGAIARTITVSGIVEPIRTIGVNSQLSGALLTIHAEEGDLVREGMVLARLDERELSAQLAAAEATYQVAAAALERAERLRERQVITLPEYERDRTAFAAAQAQRDQLRTRLGYATVRAPITGLVTEKRVEAGDVVAPQTRLFAIADISTMVVRVQVSELDVVELSAGDEVDVVLDAYPARRLDGRIRRVLPVADPTTRLVPVEVALEGESARLARPGFLARVTFALQSRDEVLLVPAAAIIGASGSEAVFVVDDGRVIRRSVVTGLISAGRVEIESGLEPGEVVVVAGNNMLSDGAAVRVVGDVRTDDPFPEPGASRPASQGATQ